MVWKRFSGITARHVATAAGVLSVTYGGFVFLLEPRAEEFVRDTVAQEQFASAHELEQQTEALRDLSARFAKQSDALEELSHSQSGMKADIEAIKRLQHETLRVLLRGQR